MAALACVASGWAGATRDDGPAGDTLASDGKGSSKVKAGPVWQTDFRMALSLAAERKRPVLLRFSAEWCPPCQVMDRSVFPDREVKAALAEQVVPVLVDIDEEQSVDLARRYGVREIPALLLIEPDGTVLDRGGFMSVEGLLEFLSGS
jgi:protein disulfide-isomerase